MATSEMNAFEKLRMLKEKARRAEEAMEAEKRARQQLEEANAKVMTEKSELMAEKAVLDEFQNKAAQLTAQKDALDNQLRVRLITCCCNVFVCIAFLLNLSGRICFDSFLSALGAI